MTQFPFAVENVAGASWVTGHWLVPPVWMVNPGKIHGSQSPLKTLSAETGFGSVHALTFIERIVFIRLSRVTPSLPSFFSICTKSHAPPMPEAYVPSVGSHGCGEQYCWSTLLYPAMTGSLAHLGSLTSLP